MKRTLSILLVAVLLLGVLTACGSKADPNLGVYKLESLSGMTVEEFAELLGEDVEATKDFMTVELKADGKATFTTEGEANEVTWKLDGDKLSLTADGDTLEGTLKDGKITLDLDGESVTLGKVG